MTFLQRAKNDAEGYRACPFLPEADAQGIGFFERIPGNDSDARTSQKLFAPDFFTENFALCAKTLVSQEHADPTLSIIPFGSANV